MRAQGLGLWVEPPCAGRIPTAVLEAWVAAAPPILKHEIWDFPKIWVPYFGGPYNKDPTIYGTRSGSLIFGNPHL